MPRSGVRTAAVLLAMPSLAWLLALLSVNSDMLLCHYLFAASNCLQVSGDHLRPYPWDPQNTHPWDLQSHRPWHHQGL